MEFRILGPLEVIHDGDALALGPTKQRALLALLLLHLNEVVPRERWGERAPDTATTALHGYISGLRKLLEPGNGRERRLLLTQAPGYQLRLDPTQLDLHRFQQLARQGKHQLAKGNAGAATATLAEALALWRGPPLAEFTSAAFATAHSLRLQELQLAALEDRIDAELALAHHHDLIAELEALTQQHPYRERLHAQRMLALYRCGRQTEALELYQQTRRKLVEELGIEPGPRLQQIERAILSHDPALHATAERRTGRAPSIATREVSGLPTGTVSFLFTDIERSTRHLHKVGAEKYAQALAEYRRTVRDACARNGGVEVDVQGDGVFVAFATAPRAVAAARELSEAFAAGPIRVRIGLHTGTPLLTEDGYVGVDVHRAARIAAAAHGGQVLMSESTAALVEEALRPLGEHRLRDLLEPISLFQLGEGDFPPPTALTAPNLPVQPTPFVGRERELAQVLALLRDQRLRVLTLTGAGGSGKTRLALQAAAEAATDYLDGVFWVPLQALRDPKLVEPTIAQLVARGTISPSTWGISTLSCCWTTSSR